MCNPRFNGFYDANFLYGSGRINALAAVNEAINISTSAQESNQLLNWNLFPNPADHYTIIRSPDPLAQLDLVMYDLTGRIIRKQILYGVEKRLELDNLPGGIYLMKISSQKGLQEFKLLQVVH